MGRSELNAKSLFPLVTLEIKIRNSILAREVTHPKRKGNIFILEWELNVGSGLWTDVASGLISIPRMGQATMKSDIALSWDSCSHTPEDLCLLKKPNFRGLQTHSRIAVGANVGYCYSCCQDTPPSVTVTI